MPLTRTTPTIGGLVQMVSTVSSAVAIGTNTVPLDDTIPQITEGDEYMTLTITPKSTTNTLVIDVRALLYNSAATFNEIGALFQDATANALAADVFYGPATGSGQVMAFTHTMAAGTTSATTFRFRAGANVAGTTTFNGGASARFFGAITKSSIVIWEIKA